MEQHACQAVNTAARKKLNLMSSQPLPYLVRSLLAGLYLALICYLFWQLKHNLASSLFGNMIASLFFGIGLFIIIVTGAELFTSNAMHMTHGSLRQTASWGQTAKLWGVCYIGNLVGSLLFALLLWGTGVLDVLPAGHLIFHGAEHKIEQSARALFFKGVLANWIVCLAVWVGLHLKEEIARFTAIVLIIFIFLYLGFEHSIANMGTFAIVLLAKNSHLAISGMLYNLFWVTLGNVVGGGGLVGAVYWWLNSRDLPTAD